MILLTSVVYQIDEVKMHNVTAVKAFTKGDLIQFQTELKEQMQSGGTQGKYQATYVTWKNLTKKLTVVLTMNASVKTLNSYFNISEADIGLVANLLEGIDG